MHQKEICRKQQAFQLLPCCNSWRHRVFGGTYERQNLPHPEDFVGTNGRIIRCECLCVTQLNTKFPIPGWAHLRTSAHHTGSASACTIPSTAAGRWQGKAHVLTTRKLKKRWGVLLHTQKHPWTISNNSRKPLLQACGSFTEPRPPI